VVESEAAVESEAVAPPAADADINLAQIRRIWPSILEQLGTTAPALAAFFEEARPVGFDDAGSTVEIAFPAGASFNKRKAEAPEQRERVAEALKAVTGEDIKPTYVILDAEETAAGDEQPATAAADDGVDEEELLRRLKSEFDAEEVS
jgi:hypothetical protein